jgi:hypothetical protein
MDNNLNQRYLKKLQFFKNLTFPIIHFLDKIRLLPFAMPIINFNLWLFKINMRFPRDLNYRIFGKALKGKLNSEISNTDKVVLIPFFTNGNNLFLLINWLILYRLQKKGYKGIMIICDQFLPICTNERIGKTREDDKHLCKNCFSYYPILEKMTGGKFVYLSNFFQDNDLLILREIENLNDIQSCKNFVYKNIEYGKIAEKSVLRFFIKGELKETEEYITVYKKFLISLVKFSISWDNFMLSIPKPDLVLLYNGTISFETYIRDKCLLSGIDYVTHETFVGDDSWIYKKNDEVMKLMWEDEWVKFARISLTEQQRNQSIGFIEGLRYGKEMYALLNEKNPLPKELVEKKYVVLFTNLNFDTAVIGRNPVFESMYQWIDEVIDFWINNEIKETLVIRVHPAEVKLVTYSDDFVAPRIAEKVKNTSNILVFEPTDKVDSYTLIENMQFGLVYSSTIGLEIPYYGKPCLIAGEAFYRNLNFVSFKNSKKEYFEELDRFLNPSEPISMDKEEIIKYIYFIYFVCVKRLKGIKMDHAYHINYFEFNKIEELSEMNDEVLLEFEKLIV